ncbi:MAG: hypothetical protein R2856_39055 [Caldilineaceae bacterium]
MGIGEDRGAVDRGRSEVGRMIIQKILATPSWVTASSASSTTAPRTAVGAPVLGSFADIPAVIDAYAVDEVIIGLPGKLTPGDRGYHQPVRA